MPLPQQIGIYTIEAHLGEGRFTQVYRALDPARKRTVALKVLTPEALADGLSIRRLLERAQAAIELVHPYLAWLWETGEADGTAFLAERYIDAPSLEHILSTRGPLEWGEAETIVQQVAQGLEYAHSRGLVHGSLKPGNILISPELGAVLTDMGLALALQGQISDPHYTAPEVWEGQPASPASDQYALACVQLEMLTGRKVIEGNTADEMRIGHLQGMPSLAAAGPGIPWQAAAALGKALSRNPEQRFSTIGQFASEAARLERGSGPEREQQEAVAASLRQAEAEAHRQAEEIARLAALEQARLELQAQLLAETGSTRQAAGPEPELPMPEASLAEVQNPVSTAASPQPGQTRRKPLHRPPGAIQWILVALGVFVLILTGMWLIRGIPWNAIFPPAPTPSPSATPTLTATPSPLPSWTPTPSPTSTASTTPTISSTPTLSPTATQTPTITDTPTRPPTATRTPHQSPNRGNESRSTGGP